MSNSVIRLRPISIGTSTPDAGIAAGQHFKLVINGLGNAGGIAVSREIVFVSDTTKHVVYRFPVGSTSMIWAGTYGVAGNADGQGGAAKFNTPTSLAVDKRGNVFVLDSGNSLIRRIDENGNVYTVAQVPSTTPGQIAVGDGNDIYVVDNAV